METMTTATTTMSSQDSAGPPRRCHYCSGDHGGGGPGFHEMFGDLQILHSYGSGDLFELVWQGGGPAGRSCIMETPPAGGDSGLPESPPLLPADQQRPSKDQMAAWLRAIVRGDAAADEPAVVVGLGKPAGGGVAGCAAEDYQPAMAPPPPQEVTTTKTEAKCTVATGSSCSERRKQRGRRYHHSETHSLTEKRRRWKINDKLKTLQQLVPGCDNKSNQTSTLEQTIKHMKSLQHQIQAMSFGCRTEPPVPAAVYPVIVPPPYCLPPPPAVAAGAALPLPPPAAFAPGVLVRGGHICPGLVLAPPPPAMLPFAANAPAADDGAGSAAAVAAAPQ